MSTRAQTAILPRDLASVPPPQTLVGAKAHGLAQLLAAKARVPRFGILTVDAFDAHCDQDTLRPAVAQAFEGTTTDEGMRTTTGEALVRAALLTTLPSAVRAACNELHNAFAQDDVLVLRASVVGEALEASAVAGALDATLGIRGNDALHDAVARMYALAFHPRTLALRVQAGLPAFGCRMAMVVQRMIMSESSGVCISLETALHDTKERAPRVYVRSTWGLAGGIGGKAGSARIVCDAFRIERPALADGGIEDSAQVVPDLQVKSEALRFDGSLHKGTRMERLLDHQRKDPSLTVAQARTVAREALRVEAALGRPVVLSFAYAGRLLHVLDVEPLLVPLSRVESSRVRTWDDRLLPGGLPERVLPLTFSVWQRCIARGFERAGRILGAKGVLLEEVRPQLPRVLGLVSGRLYGNLEVMTALLDLLPFADKARAALAEATGQAELIPRKPAPPGFWQRQRQKLDEGRWMSQLEGIASTTADASAHLSRELRQTLATTTHTQLRALDPDTLLDLGDEVEDALSKALAVACMSGLCAMLQHVELSSALKDAQLQRSPGLLTDLLGGDVDDALIDGLTRVYTLVAEIRTRPVVLALMRTYVGDEEALAHHIGMVDGHGGVDHEDVRWLHDQVRTIARAPLAACVSELALDAPRLHERPEPLLGLVSRLVDTPAAPQLLHELLRDALGARKKAEYACEQAFSNMSALRGPALRKRTYALLVQARVHDAACARAFVDLEQLVAQLRAIAQAFGERLFEHGLLEHPRDVFQLEYPELSGIVRGTGVDVDIKPLVAARKRSAVARPADLPRRIETRGVVATSLLSHDDDADAHRPAATAPGLALDVLGRGIGSGDVAGAVMFLDASNGARPQAISGVVIGKVPMLATLPLACAATAAVFERGTRMSPAAFVLRALGVPTVVDVSLATVAFVEGSAVRVDAARGTVTHADNLGIDTSTVAPTIDPASFAREAVVSDPRMHTRAASRPADFIDGLPPPPIVRPAGTDDGFESPPHAALRAPSSVAAPGASLVGPADTASLASRIFHAADGLDIDVDAAQRASDNLARAAHGHDRADGSDEATHVNEHDILERTDISTESSTTDPNKRRP